MKMKFEVCAVMSVEPIIIEADSIEEACEIAYVMNPSDFNFLDMEITDVYEVDGE